MRHFIPTMLLALACINASAQRKCGTEEALSQRLLLQPKLANKLRLVEGQLQRQRPDNRLFRINPRVTIPVVVHIVLPDPSVVTNTQVLSQLESLNLDYLAQNSDITKVPAVWQALIGNSEVQFCLASRTPDGDPTNGIIRTTTSRSSFAITGAAQNVKYAATGGDPAWDHNRYINIWVCNLSDNYLGVATPPGDIYPAEEDGVVVHYRAFGNTGSAQAPYNLGRTLTHEIGHFFGLHHIWADDSGGCTEDDGVGDTPKQGNMNYGCPSFPLTDNCSNTAPGIMFMNYMDYVNDACMYLFTTGQTDRMRNALDLQRLPLLSSDGCTPVTLKVIDASVTAVQQPQGYLCAANQAPVVTLRNRGTDPLTSVIIRYSVNNGMPVNYNWTGNLGSQQQIGVTLPAFNASEGSYTLKAYTDLPNGSADQQHENDTTAVEFSYRPPVAFPFTETFEGAMFPPAGFSITNPDRSFTWERGSTGSRSSSSAVMRNLGYAMNNQVDDLTGPVVDGTSADSVFLFFDVAAAVTSELNMTNNPWDTLEVLVTNDCGQTFIKTGYKKYGSTLITRQQPANGEFIPASNEWRRDSVDLTPFVYHQQFRVVFRNTTNFENNVYIDNINIVKKDQNRDLRENGILIWPNTFSRQFYIEFATWPDDLLGIMVYDASGRQVYQRQPVNHAGNRVTIDLVNEANGLYFVKLFYRQQVRTYKIVKAK